MVKKRWFTLYSYSAKHRERDNLAVRNSAFCLIKEYYIYSANMEGDRSFHSDCFAMKRKVFIVISSGSFNGKVV